MLAISVEAMQVICIILAGMLIIGVAWELFTGKWKDQGGRRR